MSLKIMVVDEDPTNIKLVRSLAAPSGHTVLTFQDSQQAAQRAEAQRFDIIFVAKHTPRLDGLELVRQFRNSELNHQTTIVVLSADDDIPSLRKAFGEGADYVFTIPLVGSRLRAMLAAMDSPGWKAKRRSARLPLFTDVQCTCGDRQFLLRSVNISESGILLQPAVEIEIGQEVTLEFKIAEVRALLNPVARVVRKQGPERMAMQFIALTPEDQNAIQLYVLGRMTDLTPPRDFSGIGMRRLFNP